MSEEDAADFLKRMTRRYRPPRWLAGSEDNTEEALDDYRRSLSRYDGEVLDRAWQMLVARHRFWCWPSIPEALEAAGQAQRELHPPGHADEMAEKVSEMTDAYLKRFMKTAAAARAREGGYEARLKEYVREVCWVQGQMIAGRQGFGYGAGILFQLGEDQEEREAFFEAARRQAETGQMKAQAPPALAKRWQSEAQGEARAR